MATVPPTVAKLFSLEGKTAVVTGGSGGLGVAMTSALAEAGANIVSIQIPNDPNGENLRKIIEQHGRSFSKFECNVRDAAELRATFQKIWERNVAPDVLLNCAGIQRRAKVEDFTDEDIDAVMPTGSTKLTKLIEHRSSILTSKLISSRLRSLEDASSA